MPRRRHPERVLLLLLCMMPAVSGCARGNLPGTSAAEIATIVVATQLAAPTNTPAPPATSTTAPTSTFTATPFSGTPSSASRVDLSEGATSARLEGVVGPQQNEFYVVRGAQGQPILVSLVSESGQATLIMMSQGGTFFLRPEVATAWRGSLPQAGDYYLGVHGGNAATSYALSFQLVERIGFAEGEDAATRTGHTPRGSIITYSVFGIKGAKLTVALSHAARRAALGVSGFIDETAYLEIGQNETFTEFVLPATQDYIIEIVPRSGQDVNYILDVKLE